MRIEAAGGDGVVGERRARRGGGIVNGGGENAAALRQRGDNALARDAGAQAGALPVGEEEGLVLADGAAEREPVLIAAELRLGSGWRKIVARVQVFIAKELEERRRADSLLPDLPITITVPPFDRPYSGE